MDSTVNVLYVATIVLLFMNHDAQIDRAKRYVLNDAATSAWDVCESLMKQPLVLSQFVDNKPKELLVEQVKSQIWVQSCAEIDSTGKIVRQDFITEYNP